MEAFSRLHAMSEGAISLMDSGDRPTVFHVVATRMVAVDEETAAPRIQQFMINQRSSELIAVEMQKIKEKANIVYLGEFANEATTAEARPAEKVDLPLQARSQGPNTEQGIRSLQ
jgi:hypothetical protein